MDDVNYYAIRTEFGNWLGYDGIGNAHPGINWVDCRCQRRTFRVTKAQARAFLSYVRTVYAGAILVRIKG